jgi:uncharacterized membrane protein YhhN
MLANRAFALFPVLYYTLEPLTVGWLLAYVAAKTRRTQYPLFLVVGLYAALVLCIAAEYLMRFAQPNTLLYGTAVGLFFVANLVFITIFLMEVRLHRRPFFFAGFWWLLPTGVGIMWLALQLLWPGIDNVRVVIVLHAISFVVMALAAGARWHAVSDGSFFSVIIGCILLALGNLLYAVNASIIPLPLGMFFNLATYYAGQLCIVTGLLHEHASATNGDPNNLTNF